MTLFLQKHSQRLIHVALFTFLVFGAFLAFFDPSILNPTNIGWISEGDLRQHYLGWTAFRQSGELGAPWGNTQLLAYPLGAPLAATDSNPLVSLILWPIEGLLPDAFQFIGPWYLLSIGLGLLIATSLLRHAGFDRITAQLLGAFLAFQPILFWRYGHDTLTAQWLILGAIHVSFVTRSFYRAVGLHAGLLLLSIMIHPYLFIMLNFVVGFDIFARAIGQLGRRFGVVELTALCFIAAQIVALFVGAKLGVFSLKTLYPNEIGVHSTDLLGFFNPFDASRFTPQLPAGPGQYEGFSYLGLGFIVLLGLALFHSWQGARSDLDLRRFAPLAAAAIVALLFALSPIVTILGTTVFDMNLSDTSPIRGIFEKLRSSGRFVWITVYVFVFALIMTLPRKFSWVTIGITALALFVQLLDLSPLRARSKADTAYREVPAHELLTPMWQERIARADYVYLSRPLGLEFSLHAGAAAFPLNTPLTFFYTAQGLGLPSQQAAEEQLRVRTLSGNYDPSALLLLDPVIEMPVMHRNAPYILATRDYGEFHALESAAYLGADPMTKATHGLTDLLELCATNCTAAIVAQGPAFSFLSSQTKLHLSERGSQVLSLTNGDGYAAVLRDGLLVEEVSAPQSNASLNAQINGRSISLNSAVDGQPSLLSIEGVDYARNADGISVALVFDSGRLVTAVYDTHVESDSLLPDADFELPLQQPETNADADLPETDTGIDYEAEYLNLSGEFPTSVATPFIGIDRYLTEESSLLDVISDCRQSCTMAISVKDEGAASMPRAVRRKAAQIGLTLSELEFRDGYSAIVENGIVLVQGRSYQDIVDVTEVVEGKRIRVQSAGFEAGNLSSIKIDSVEHSMGQRGVNIVVLLEGERIITYHFDTHGGL